ncbi:MAG TPA: hypothetical protein VMT99_02990 [Candidatus Paceibacterota bacterium]|nr:hypothetical protein [Candidatus Paceibacterota bacterium]
MDEDFDPMAFLQEGKRSVREHYYILRDEGYEEVNLWLERLFAAIFFLPVAVLWIERCLDRDAAFKLVPVLTITVFAVIAWVIWLKVRPLGLIGIIAILRFSDDSRILAELPKKLRTAALVTQALARRIFGIWGFILLGEIIFCLALWLGFGFNATKDASWTTMIFHTIVLGFVILMIVWTKTMRNIWISGPLVAATAALFVWTFIGDAAPRGFSPKIADGRNQYDLTEPKEKVAYQEDGFRNEYHASWEGEFAVIDRSDGWVSIACPDKSFIGPIRTADDGNAKVAEDIGHCPDAFLVQGKQGGYMILAPTTTKAER